MKTMILMVDQESGHKLWSKKTFAAFLHMLYVNNEFFKILLIPFLILPSDSVTANHIMIYVLGLSELFIQ